MNTQAIERAPLGVFRGNNFMTPTTLGYFRATFRGKTVYLELSEGTGMSGEPIYGVTFRRADGGELWREGYDPSRMFHDRKMAMEYIQAGPHAWEPEL